MTKADGTKNSDISQFSIVDSNYTGSLEYFTFGSARENTHWTDLEVQDFVIDPENSYTQCTANGELVTCSDVNLRWMRNFTTEDGANDAQLTVDDAGVAKPAWSFFGSWRNEPHRGDTP